MSMAMHCGHAQEPKTHSDRFPFAGNAVTEFSYLPGRALPPLAVQPFATRPLAQSPTRLAQAATSAKPEGPVSPEALKFDIERYVVEGNTLLKANAISTILAPYTGKQKDFA